jgi:AAA ATPase
MNYLTGIRLNSFPDDSSYLSRLPVVKYLKSVDRIDFNESVTFFVGENGTGKSTLLEAIAVAMGFNPEGGSRDFAFSTKDSHSELYQHITTIKTIYPKDGFFLRAESFYNTASYLDQHSSMLRYGGVSFHEQSHGESFLSLVTNRFEGNGIYILDEPEAALSPQRLMTLIVAIDELVKNNSQFIIATHSPILMSYPRSEIMQLSDSGIEKVSFKETDHYKITKQFIDRPEQMLRYLLNE